MKLFIWASPYPVNCGSSMFFAVAEDEERAREIAKTAKAYAFVEYGESHPGNVTLGKPTRVLDLPCGEWHEWAE